jgi:hypothetical protein
MWTSLPLLLAAPYSGQAWSCLRRCCHARTDCFNRRTILRPAHGLHSVDTSLQHSYQLTFVRNSIRHDGKLTPLGRRSLRSAATWMASNGQGRRGFSRSWRTTHSHQSNLTSQGGKIVSLNVKSDTYH